MPEPSHAERTERPSARRIARARRAGQVAISSDLVAAGVFSAACVVLIATGRGWAGGLLGYMRTALAGAASTSGHREVVAAGLQAMTVALAGPLAVAVACGLLVGIAQTRGNLAIARWQRGRRSGGGMFRRLVAGDRAAMVVVDLLKLGLIGAVAAFSLYPVLGVVANLAGGESMHILVTVAVAGRRLAGGVAFAMVTLGCADYLWQVRRHRTRMRMTRDEAKREHRESEGDSELKAERHRRHGEIQLADDAALDGGRCVLLVDPGRTFVALALDEARGAPMVVLARVAWADGHRLDSLARQLSVPRSSEPSLVRALTDVPVGERIPHALVARAAQAIARARSLPKAAGPGGAAPIAVEVGHGSRPGT